MKAYLFIETGEVRRPTDGEFYQMGKATCVANDNFWKDEFPILTRHEIILPEDAEMFRFYIDPHGSPIGLKYGEIPIPRPKKKVKKWRWAYERTPYPHDFDQPTHVRISDRHYATEGELRVMGGIVWCQRLEHTEIEVEE